MEDCCAEDSRKVIVIVSPSLTYTVQTLFLRVAVRDYIEERAISIANYIIEHGTTVRQTAKDFGVSKSTVHKVVTKCYAFSG